MKKRINILLICFFILESCVLYGQNPAVDSLLHVLKTTTEDTTKVNTLNDLFLKFEFSDDAKSQEYLKQALELGEKINYKKGLSVTYSLFGFFEEDKGNFEVALKKYMQSLELAKESGNKNCIADAYDYIGIAYYNLGNYSEALKNNFASLKIRQEIKNMKNVSASYNNIGNVYLYLGNYPEALKNHLASLKAAEARGDKRGIAYAHWGVGSIYYKMKQYPEAIKNYEACLKLATEIDDKTAIASSYNNLANVFSDRKDFALALASYSTALEIYKSMGSKSGIALSYGNIGTVYFSQTRTEENPNLKAAGLEKALKSYFASLEIEQSIDHKAEIASTCNNIGIVYTAQKKYDQARIYLRKSEVVAKEIGYKDYLKDTYFALTQLDSATGNYKEAYENNKLFILYRDSLDNEETRKKTIQSQMNYDFDKKEAVAEAEHKKELENQTILSEEKSRKQKTVLSLVLGTLLIVIVFAAFIFRSLRTARKQKDIIELQKTIVEQQKREVEFQKYKVEDHQKEIIDSILYARRIQQSLLPTEKYIDKNLTRLKNNK